MEFAEVVRKRRMVRNFSPEPVAPEAIERILALARQAPSAGYTQGQSFVVVKDAAARRAIARACDEDHYVTGGFDPFISTAPVLLIPCTSEAAYHRRYQEADKTGPEGKEIEWPVPYWHMDIGCSVMVVLLAAVAEGLAAGYAGAHDLDALRAVLSIPAEVTPVGVIPIGHRAPDVPSPSLKRGRRPEAEFIHRERW
ncbi:MAG TPA: nitroreductase family protein [Ktedonobacterales bacterium]|nr:nitroreductase family protein [Ktedonobacterales bacterium]